MCELHEDLTQQFPQGLDTLIGERGLNISGGQKTRIALARACYADADTYFLDDPLSAVDSRVAARLLSNCIRGYLKHKAVVLATHNLTAVPYATRVLALSPDGRPLYYGPPAGFQEFSYSSPHFLFMKASH